MERIYKANITAGALLIPESRKIADLLIRRVSASEWKSAIEIQNILQKLSKASAMRVAALIKIRLELMTPELWKMVRDGDSILTTQALLAASIKHCRMLGDYLDVVVRGQFNNMENRLTPLLWDEFIISCKQRDPFMEDFPPSTAVKMRSATHKILVEAGYLVSSHDWKLKRVEIVPELIEYLKQNNEEYVLNCIQVSK